MKRTLVALAAAAIATAAQAQETKVAIAISGWTRVAPVPFSNTTVGVPRPVQCT